MKRQLSGMRFPSDLTILLFIAAIAVAVHMSFIQQYGYHRDELATIEDALHLDWGFIAYPPLTPAVARLGLAIFGIHSMGYRLCAVLALAAAAILTGLMAGEIGAKRWGKILATLAVLLAPVVMGQSAVFQYVSFDYLWWVCLAYLIARLAKRGDPKTWLGIGAVIGLGMMTKYTMAFWILGLAGGVLICRRDWLRSPWLWAGALVSILIFAPNIVWQAQHNWISLDFLSSIHARDVRIGRADGFLAGQLIENNLTVLTPLWIAGLWALFFRREGRPYQVLGWMFVIAAAAFTISRARSYYLAPAYPALIAAGSAWLEGWLSSRSREFARRFGWGLGIFIAINATAIALITVPFGPVNGPFWKISSRVHDLFREEIGWPELAQTTAQIYHALPAGERAQTGIFAGNYGEAGAINLYGPDLGLPRVLSTTNSFWLYGYGDHPPKNLIVLGVDRKDLDGLFDSCQLAGHNGNPYEVINEESKDHPDIFMCYGFRADWARFWQDAKNYG